MSADPESLDKHQPVELLQGSRDTPGQNKWMRLRPLLVLLALACISGFWFMRRVPEKFQEPAPPPPRENLERSRQVQPGILQLRGWEFEEGSVGESLFRFIESGAPDYARTVLVFKNIDFAVDTLNGLSPSQEKELDDLAAVLMTFPGIKVEIGAHSDQNRDFLLSYTLSRKEAETVKKVLVKKGIPEAQMQTRAFGFEFPLTDNISEEAKAQNRRVELLLLEMNLSTSREGSPEKSR